MNEKYPIDIYKNNELSDKKHLGIKEKESLLEDKKKIIDECIEEIQTSFYKLGKTLAEIKDKKLYKADKLYKKWKDFVRYRIEPKLHQSTISDYIAIVKMQLSNKDYIGEKEILNLGYKKAKLLKSQYNKILRIADENKKTAAIKKFKSFYKESINELQELPYQIMRKKLEKEFKLGTNNDIIDIDKNGLNIKYNKRNSILTIKSKDKNKINDIFSKLINEEI